MINDRIPFGYDCFVDVEMYIVSMVALERNSLPTRRVADARQEIDSVIRM
jgi:hypothetical protein